MGKSHVVVWSQGKLEGKGGGKCSLTACWFGRQRLADALLVGRHSPSSLLPDAPRAGAAGSSTGSRNSAKKSPHPPVLCIALCAILGVWLAGWAPAQPHHHPMGYPSLTSLTNMMAHLRRRHCRFGALSVPALIHSEVLDGICSLDLNCASPWV